MKAIVVRQPWATLIALGIKTIETRPAPPNGPMRPDGVRGLPGLAVERGERIAILAGAAIERGFFPIANVHHLGGPVTSREWRFPNGHHLPAIDGVTFPLGAVVCTVTVDDALPIVAETGSHADELYLTIDGRNLARQQVTGDGSRPEHVRTTWLDDQLPFGDFTPGRWGWMLTDPQPCDPIPCKGKQGVFRLPDDVAERVRGEG